MLRPLGGVYALLMRARRLGYERSILTSWRPPVPCICVGNIGWGGSGKTPLCDWLLDWFTDRKIRPVLLTRGYRARPPRLPYLVRPDSPPSEAGDEPLLLARSSGAPVLIDPRRDRSGAWAMGHLDPEVFILDDGFQHLKVQRDLNLVLLRPEDLEKQWNRVLPFGSWREGPSALESASAFALNCTPDRFQTLSAALDKRLRVYERPVFSFFLKAVGFIHLSGRTASEPDQGAYCLVTGLADPRKPLQTASEALGRPPEHHLVFADHHPYSTQDWTEIVRAADSAGCRTILCTPKDFVKLSLLGDERLWTFDLGLRFGPTRFITRDFSTWLGERWTEISGH